MQFETPAQYNARQARCRMIARGMTRDEAMRTASLLGRIPTADLTRDERDRFVAANIAIREA